MQTLTFALLALGVGWRAYTWALGLPIWGDEAFVAVNLLVRDFAGMWDPLVYGQIAPLVFMWGELAVARILGYSEQALHLLPCIAGIAGLILYARFARRAFPPSAALLGVGLLAGAYFTARHAVEVKPYSFDLLVAVIFTALGWELLRHPRCLRRWARLVIFSGIAIWCSYPAMLVGGAVGLAVTVRLIKSSRDSRLGGQALRSANALRQGASARAWLGWAAFGLVLCANAFVMYRYYAKPHAEQSKAFFELASWADTFPPVKQPWKLPQWFVHVHLGNMFAYPQGGAAPGSVATFFLFCVGAWRLWRKDREFFILLIGPFLLTFIAAAMRGYPYGGSARVAQHVAPAICLLAGLGGSVLLRRFLRGRRLRVGLVACAIALTFIPIGSMVRSTVKPYKSLAVRKSQDAVRTIAEQTKPQDRWIVFNADRPVEWAPFLGDWRGVGGQFVFDTLRFAPEPIRPVIWSPDPDSIEPHPGGRIWLLVYYAQRDKVAFDDDQLAAYVAKVAARLGPPKEEVLPIEEKASKYEALKVYRFES